MQEALNHYVNQEIGKVTVSGGILYRSQVMSAYNTATGSGRYGLFSGYLDEATRTSFSFDTGSGKLTTQAMRDTGRYLTLPDWTAGSFPKIQFN